MSKFYSIPKTLPTYFNNVPEIHPNPTADDLIDAMTLAVKQLGTIPERREWRAQYDLRVPERALLGVKADWTLEFADEHMAYPPRHPEAFRCIDPSRPIRGHSYDQVIIDDPLDLPFSSRLNWMRTRRRMGGLYRRHGVGMKWLAQREREIGKPNLPDAVSTPYPTWRPYDEHQ